MDAEFEIGLDQSRKGTPRRPLLGLTLLMVEDSRYCSEAVRLLCLRSGARLRRADSLGAAYRHLSTYRPNLVLVDVGLPDASGLDLVRDLAGHRPNAPVILVTSGEDQSLARQEALIAGADGYLEKPIRNVQAFQDAVLQHFPERKIPQDATNVVPFRIDVDPDPLAVDEDLRHARDLMISANPDEAETLFYCAQFLNSLAEATGADDIARLAQAFRLGLEEGRDRAALVNGVALDLANRLGLREAI